ncbi:MAG: GNAT family N-acetyltransferase [Candidatus Levyibacteriota bacterium]
MQIRRATSQDKKELSKLLIEFDHITDAYLPTIQKQFRAYSQPLEIIVTKVVDKYVSPDYITFIAEEHGVLMGYCCGKIEKREDKLYAKGGHIEGWFVKEAEQTQGVGKELLEALVVEFKNVECTHLSLDAHLENTKAVAIYKHLGFTKRLVTFFKLLKDLA